jgi:exopolysaccharide biosynthesis WecB/TagA/CpsF family protein
VLRLHNQDPAPLVSAAPGSRQVPEAVRVMRVPFHGPSFADAVGSIRDMIRGTDTHQVILANAHTLNLAWHDPAYRRLLERADLVLRDGVGVEIAARLRGRPLEVNFCGTDFVARLLGALVAERPRVFLYGARPGVAAAAGAALIARAPGMRLVGVENGFGDRVAVAARIRAACPDVLLVALGNPLQEFWIAEHLRALDARVAIGVGALFDYLAGRVRRAPRWVRALRSEWVFRMLMEPRRLAQRYLVGNPVFLWRSLLTLGEERR